MSGHVAYDTFLPDKTSHLPGNTPLPRLRAGSESTDLKFAGPDAFRAEVRRRVDSFFLRSGRRRRDCVQMYVKTAILTTVLAASYVLLVFVVHAWWEALPLAILLGLVAGAIGFNIQHDGGHRSYSRFAWVNKSMALTLDVLGGSSYLWHRKHVALHHTYVNITGHDTDIDLGIVARLTPHQKRLVFHRWQHWYIWPLYGVMAIRWQFFSDFQEVISGRIGGHRFPRPKGRDLALFIGGKLVFLAWAFAIPLWFRSVGAVALYYVVATVALGLVLSVVFQLAHCVELADFPLPQAGTGVIENGWADHQVETTVDFARNNPVVTWLLGGLNYQIEHHLFPQISHVHYPAISTLVEDACRDFGVRYREHKSVWSGVASHFRWLRQMGRT